MKQIQIIVLCLIFTGFLIANNYSDNELEFMELMKVMENEDLVENFINNKSVVEAKIKEFNRDLDTDMIIITCDDFLYWFEQFAQIKKEEGVITVVVSTSTIGSTKGQIRNYLASQKQNNPNLQYVLLGGDENIIPAQNLNWIKSGEEIISSTDFYYSNVLSGWDEDMMELDLSPDLYVGRIPARNLSDVTKFYVKYQNYRYDYLDHTDDMAFVATNILKLPNITPDDNLVDSIIVHVDDNINIDCLHTYDLVDTLNGCAQSVINKLKDRDYSFFYGMWHGGDCYVIYDSEYNNYNDWWLNSFGTHRQDITINTNRVNEGSCWYSGPIDEGEHQGEYKYNYSRPALNYIQIEDEIPNINGNTYVAWISSCYTMDFFRDSWSIPVQRDTLDNIIQNYDITGNLFDYYVEAVPDTVFNVENCISKVLFNELGGPVALYATSTDDSPYFTKRVTQYYFDLQFDQYEHKLGNLTRDCWNIAENVLIYRNPRTIYLGYTLFGDPSMDVWCAEPDEFVIDAMDNTITAMNSQGIFEDGVTICVLDDNGVLKGRGLSPYTYTAGDIEDNWIITANKANFKQYKDTYLNSLVPVPLNVDVCVDSCS
nr:hypothetical protein [Candidatus Cloacimonadota bacterium]